MLRGAPGAVAPGASAYAVCGCAELRVHTRGCWANFCALTPTSSRAGQTNSRTGRSDVASLKPMTPLQPLMEASMKPPSPLLTPEQRPLKPVAPLQPKNARKTPISHPQRRQGFQPHTDTSEQRRHGFHTTAQLTCARRLRCQQTPMHPPLRKLARNSITPTHQQRPETLKYQRIQFKS